MIPTGVQIFVALEPIDLRYSFDRLSGIALCAAFVASQCLPSFAARE